MGKEGAVLVVGGGVAGIQASLELARLGFYVYLAERGPSIGGGMAYLDKTFPTEDCALCILSPFLVECARHRNVEILTGAEVESLSGEPGSFRVKLKIHPRGVKVEECRACGACFQVCPVEVPDEFNQGLSSRKAVYQPYPQAFPRAAVIDWGSCTRCGRCRDACPTKAIDLEMEPEERELSVGAILLTPGFSLFSPAGLSPAYGRDLRGLVITSLEMERILSASGPFGGAVARPQDRSLPRRIAWLQCVGSRDRRLGRPFCSSVCCMIALKQAHLVRERTRGAVDTAIFGMDLRAFGKHFEEYALRVQEDGVRFIPCRIHSLTSAGEGVRLRWVEGGVKEEVFDLVVLSLGLAPPAFGDKLLANLGIPAGPFGFCPQEFAGTGTGRPGIFVAGTFAGPKDIPEAVTEATAAVGEISSWLREVRGTRVVTPSYPPPLELADEPRIGVVVCDCGTNIRGVVKVPEVVVFARQLPGVVWARECLYACSQDSQQVIKKAVLRHRLNRLVVVACSPRTHRPLFRETLQEVGLNPYLLEMVNIRDHCSWVHSDPEAATAKAQALCAMGVAKAARLKPLSPARVPIVPRALVVGGGVAGLTAACSLADQGVEVILVEKTERIGGKAREIYYGLDGEDPRQLSHELAEKVQSHPRIKVCTKTVPISCEGFVGNFRVRLSNGEEVRCGAIILATGALPHRPRSFLYGTNPRVTTLWEFEEGWAKERGRFTEAQEILFLQCVESRTPERPYCSRVCCSKTALLARQVKEELPFARVYVLCRDVRTYGFREKLYDAARAAGVVYLRYTPDRPPQVEEEEGELKVTLFDPLLEEELVFRPDLLVLATPMVAPPDRKELAQIFKVPVDEHGFFWEAHPKLRPVDFAAEGIFLCGTAHSPRSLKECLIQAKAAAARAASFLLQEELEGKGEVARVDPSKCVACLTCVRVCPYGAPRYSPGEGVVAIEPLVCQGCGTCVGECPNAAIELEGYRRGQMAAAVTGLLGVRG
ncbi:4Fe-4S binding protein [Ammonifex thiophilus]|uniref:CoB--CoM heterodisulfide reductase iron-sulfur subunit A family protein n=1 Tax=Ammonifex thiophilus TaxID=444093 RepID=A0A3D8P8W4_9THEO|nr:4Fe-4S binding protein [Ammonifex thiophilus]RDV84869.1 CoB--CoM heterodisulfide reductase iron-sulfur subunit A family protein [Ammonifex thiophilus]